MLRPVLLCVLSFCTTLCVAEKPWTEIRSAHFRLITDGEDSAANRVLLHFELMRSVFEAQSPNFKLEAPAPLLILAPKDEASAKRLLPWMWARPGTKPAGIYWHGWEQHYALVRLDVIDTDPEGYQTVYHEYMHNGVHINFQGLPVWLDEGLADFYGYTRFDKDKMYIGAPPSIESVRDMDSWPSMPLAAFINSSVYSSDWEKTHRSYLQAWGLTHFLFFGPDMGNGKRLGQFLEELERGVEQNKAFEETIGKFADVQGAYDKHVHTLDFAVVALPVPPQLSDKNFTERKLSSAETEAEMAAWYIRFHDWDRMRESTEAALKDDPNLPLPTRIWVFLNLMRVKTPMP